MSTIPRNENPLGGAMPYIREIPKPGSEEAIEQGCPCREIHNTNGSSFYVVRKGCPLHNPERRE